MNHLVKYAIGALVSAFVLAACDHDASVEMTHTRDAAVQNAVTNEFAKSVPENAPVLYVSADATYPPFAFHDKNGNVIGLDVDMIHAIASDQGMKVVVRHQPWEKVFTDITTADNKNQHIVVSAMAAEEGEGIALERSDTYLLSPNIIVVPADSPIYNVGDLTDKRVSVRAESVAIGQLQQLGIKPSSITESTGTYLSFKALARGETDAVIDDNTVLSHHMSDYPEVKLRTIGFANEPGAESLVMAVAQGNTELLQKINTGLANIRANGTYDRILTKWGLDAKVVTPVASTTTPVMTP